MRITSERVGRLTGLGFTEGQARAYLALLDLGEATVGEVARATGVPRTRLYPVFTELHSMGLADVLEGEPLRYGPRSLERFLHQRIEGLREERDRLEGDAPALLREFRLGPEPSALEGATRVFRGRRNTMEHLREVMEAAEQRLTLGCSLRTLDRLAGAGLDHVLACRVVEGTKVEVLLPSPVRLEGALANLMPDLLTVRILPAPLPVEVMLADGRRTVATTLKPDDRSWTKGDDEGLVSTSPAMHALFLGVAAGGAAPDNTLSVMRGRTTHP